MWSCSRAPCTYDDRMTEGFERHPHARRRTSRHSAWRPLGAFALAAVCVPSVATNFADGNATVASIVAVIAVVLALVGLGFLRMQRPARAQFRYINAVVMTHAEQPPIDSWVHLAPIRPLPWPLLVSGVVFTLGMCGGAIFGVLQLAGVLPRLNPDSTVPVLVFASAVAAVIAAVSAWLTYLSVAQRWRNGRFGARPSGIALGEHTVSVRVPGRDAEIRWEDIGAVRPVTVTAKDADIPMIRLELARGADIPGNVQMLPGDTYTVPGDALFTALRWYQAHPESRWELGRVEGERRIAGWRLDALA